MDHGVTAIYTNTQQLISPFQGVSTIHLDFREKARTRDVATDERSKWEHDLTT